MNIQDRIQELCQKNGLSLSKLAKQSGLSETTVYDWFNENNRTPSIKALEDICLVFEISLAEFFSAINPNELSEKEIRLLELFRKLPDKNKEKALSMLEMLMD
jgi:transcriptional regulator with XRE-family HTH domain